MRRVWWLLFVACGRTALVSERRFEDAGVVDAGSVDAGRPDAGAKDAGFDAGLRDAGVFDAGVFDAGVVDAGIPTDCRSGSGPMMVMPCVARVQVLSLVPTMPTCFIDTPFQVGSVGVLRWDCGSELGGAEVQFDAGRFVGSFTRAQGIDVCFGSRFPWSDGCEWTSAQTIRGAPTVGARLSMTYGEAPVPGELGCVVPCAARGELEVLPNP